MRRVAGIGGILAGLALVVGTFVVGGFRAAAAGQRLLDLSRPELTKEGTAALRRDFNNVSASGLEVVNVIFPTYAKAEGMTQQQFGPVFLARYPALAAAGVDAPTTIAATDKAITNIEQHQKDFAPADSIPLPSVPLTVAPAITLAIGAALIVAGILTLVRPSGRVPLVALALIGAVVLVFTLAGGTFHKVAATHDLVASLNITKASAVDTRHHLDVQEAGGRELANRVLPDLQAKLKMTDQQFDAFLAAQTPHLDTIRSNVTGAVARFEVDANIREKGFGDFGIIRGVPIRLLPWLYLVAGLVALLAGGAALLADGRARVGNEAVGMAPATTG